MALAEAILVCLTEGDQSGYDVAKTFQTSIGFFWSTDHQRIYRELKKLLEQGFVEFDEVAQTDKPNKKIYSITQAGENRLLEWSHEISKTAAIKDDMLVKLYALDRFDHQVIKAQILERRGAHEERLAIYRRISTSRYASLQAEDVRSMGKLMSLRLGIRTEESWIAWCDESLSMLESMIERTSSLT